MGEPAGRFDGLGDESLRVIHDALWNYAEAHPHDDRALALAEDAAWAQHRRAEHESFWHGP